MNQVQEHIQLQLNGEAYRLPPQHSLQDLMQTLGLEKQALALAVNREVVPRARWGTHYPQAGDQIDIVRAIGGG